MPGPIEARLVQVMEFVRKVQIGIGGLFVLWVLGMALWAAAALARIARQG